MTLAQIIAQNPGYFRQQEWYQGEAFLQTYPKNDAFLKMPDAIIHDDARIAPEHACNLAALYLLRPTDPIWNRYLWCKDVDSLGQQIYLGVNNGKMEIHRHIHITERFGVPVWD